MARPKRRLLDFPDADVLEPQIVAVVLQFDLPAPNSRAPSTTLQCARICSSAFFYHAALEQDPFWLKAALESGGDPNQMNNAKGLQKGRPLYFAIMKRGRIENVKLLCEHGADVNAPIDELGLTAFFNVCGHFEIVHYLLECGADPAEPRPVHERNSFIYIMRQMKPELYDELKLFPKNKEWCTAVWDWLKSHGKDPEKAKWNGSKWIWDGEN